MFDTMMRELNEKILSDADGSEEQESFSFHEETVSNVNLILRWRHCNIKLN